MKKIIKLTAVAAALLIAVVMTCTVFAHSFTDVKEYDDAIGTLASIGVIRGTTTTTYTPDADVTRWQMALLITKLVTGNTDDLYWYPADDSFGFLDIIPDHYCGSIAYAAKNGIIIGRSATEFAPNDGITAQDAATMLVRALGYPRADYDAGYPNSYIKEANNLGLFDDLNDIVFTKTLTRGQTAQMLLNTFNAVRRGGGTIAADVFDYRDMRLALCATHTLSINASAGISGNTDRLTFCELNSDGTFGTSAFTLDPAIFGLQSKTEAELNLLLGKAWHIVAVNGFKTVLSLQESASRSYTDGLTAASSNATSFTLDRVAYTPVSSYTYTLSDNAVPSQRQIIVYGLGEMFNLTEPLKIADIYGSCAYYTVTAYDDNADGYFDRALYKPYGFGSYANSNGSVTVTGLNVYTLKEANITITGQPLPSANTSMLFSYLPQSGELDILRVLPEFSGRIALYDSASISIYNTTAADAAAYTLGNESVFGAHNTSVAARIISASNDKKLDFKTCAVKYVLDGAGILKLTIDEKDKATVNIVTGSGYTSSKACCVVQSIGTEYIDYGLVGLTIISSEGTTDFIYALNYNGNKLNKELAAAIRPGDILEYTKRSDKYTLDNVGGVWTIYDVTQISDKPHATVGNSTAYKYFVGCEGEYIGLGSKINEKGSIQYVAQVKTDAKTKVVAFDGINIVNITAEALKDGYEKQTGGDYAMYVSMGSDGIADYVFFRGEFKAVEVAVSKDYTTIVYFSPLSTRIGNYEVDSGTVTYKNVINLLTGERTDVYYSELVEPGYYRAMADTLGKLKLVSSKKVEENVANSYIEFYKDAVIISVSVTTGTKPVYQVTVKESETVSHTYTVTSLVVYGPNSDKSDVTAYTEMDMMALISRISETDYCIADIFLKPSKNNSQTDNMTIIIKLI